MFVVGCRAFTVLSTVLHCAVVITRLFWLHPVAFDLIRMGFPAAVKDLAASGCV